MTRLVAQAICKSRELGESGIEWGPSAIAKALQSATELMLLVVCLTTVIGLLQRTRRRPTERVWTAAKRSLQCRKYYRVQLGLRSRVSGLLVVKDCERLIAYGCEL